MSNPAGIQDAMVLAPQTEVKTIEVDLGRGCNGCSMLTNIMKYIHGCRGGAKTPTLNVPWQEGTHVIYPAPKDCPLRSGPIVVKAKEIKQ